jgi:hypothetical protein
MARPAPEANVRLGIKSNAVKLYVPTCPFASTRTNVKKESCPSVGQSPREIRYGRGKRRSRRSEKDRGRIRCMGENTTKESGEVDRRRQEAQCLYGKELVYYI